jgi:hypothetical protein
MEHHRPAKCPTRWSAISMIMRVGPTMTTTMVTTSNATMPALGQHDASVAGKPL